MISGFTVDIDRATLACSVRGAEPEKIRLVGFRRNTMVMVFHTSGGNYWSSIGRQNYAPSKFCVCSVKDLKETNEGITVKIKERIAEFPAMSRHWTKDWMHIDRSLR